MRRILSSASLALALCLACSGCSEFADYYPEGAADYGRGPGFGRSGTAGSGDTFRDQVIELGPEDAYVRDLAFFGNLIYAGTDQGQVFFSSPSSEPLQWESQGFVPAAVKAMFASSEGTLLVSTDVTEGTLIYRYSRGEYLLSDQGIDEGGPVLRLAADAAGEDLYALTSSAMYLSVDDGESWTMMLSTVDRGCADFIDLEAHPSIDRTAFVLARCGGRPAVFRTLDSGSFWNRFEIPTPGGEEAWCLAASAREEERLTAAGRGGIWSSEDLGKTWTLVKSTREWALHFDGAYNQVTARPVFVGEEAVNYELLLQFGAPQGDLWLQVIVDGVPPADRVYCPRSDGSSRCYAATQGAGVVAIAP